MLGSMMLFLGIVAIGGIALIVSLGAIASVGLFFYGFFSEAYYEFTQYRLSKQIKTKAV